MAIQIVVKSVSEDFSLFGEEAKFTKLAGKDVYEVFDTNQNILYCVPVDQIRYMQIVSNVESPLALEGPKRTAIYLNENEVFIQADRFEFVNVSLGNPSTNIELYTLIGEQLFKEFIVPFQNLKYIDFNHSTITLPSGKVENVENGEEPVTTSENPVNPTSENVSSPNGEKKPFVRIKPRS